MTEPMTEGRFVSACCAGETCFCGQPAVAKVGETIFFDDPQPNRHELTSYICAAHFRQIMGPAAGQPVPETEVRQAVRAYDEIVAKANRGIGYLNGHGGPSGNNLKEVATTFDELLRAADSLITINIQFPAPETLEGVKAALEKIANKDGNHIVSGSPGPLYTAGWNSACGYFGELAQKALALLTGEGGR